MKVLISAVGTTDPFSRDHDGPIVHICRHLRPDKVILFFSEELFEKEQIVKQGIASIENYNPIVEVATQLIPNDDVHVYDKMYDYFYRSLSVYINNEDDFILNLSSGTPQITGALFAINRIRGYNTKAVQVYTPVKGANNFKGDQRPIEILIAENKDRQAGSTERIIEDQSDKFQASLIRKSLRELIANYDYKAAHQLLNSNLQHFGNQQNIHQATKTLDELVSMFDRQKVIGAVGQLSKLSPKAKTALNYYLILKAQYNRGQLADCLVKAKSMCEFLILEFMAKYYSNVFSFGRSLKLNKKSTYYTQIIRSMPQEMKIIDDIIKYPHWSYIVQLLIKDASESVKTILCLLKDLLETMDQLNVIRNHVAHYLGELNYDDFSQSKIKDLIEQIESFIQVQYKLNPIFFEYLDKYNEKLIQVIN